MKTHFKPKLILMGVLIILLLFAAGCDQGAETEASETVKGDASGEVSEPEATTALTKPPEPTNTPVPEMTPTSTPEADPRQELGNSAWGATFEDGTETWFQYDNENSSAEVRDNMLVLTSKKANSYDDWSMSFPPMTDFYLELRFTTGPECSGKDRFGIFFRAPESTLGWRVS